LTSLGQDWTENSALLDEQLTEEPQTYGSSLSFVPFLKKHPAAFSGRPLPSAGNAFDTKLILVITAFTETTPASLAQLLLCRCIRYSTLLETTTAQNLSKARRSHS
jgi:hypothetical protein